MAVVLALSAGARQQEIWGLRWSEVDLERELITFTETKNDEFNESFHHCRFQIVR